MICNINSSLSLEISVGDFKASTEIISIKLLNFIHTKSSRLIPFVFPFRRRTVGGRQIHPNLENQTILLQHLSKKKLQDQWPFFGEDGLTTDFDSLL